jgi:outer membrane lipoprotein-sorting protein
MTAARPFVVLAALCAFVICGNAVADEYDPQEIYATVLDNEANLSTLQADFSITQRLYDTYQEEYVVTVNGIVGSTALKKSSSVPGGMLKHITTYAADVNSEYDMWRGSDTKTYVDYWELDLVLRRNTAIGGAQETVDTSTLEYVTTQSIDGVSCKVIEGSFEEGAAYTSTKFWIDTSNGVILKREYYDETGLVASYVVDPDDVTTVGDYALPTKSTAYKYDCVDEDHDLVTTTTLSNVSVNASISDGTFTYTIPQGYTVDDLD